MAELGRDENKKKCFLSHFNTLQAPPKKKGRKQMLKKEVVRLSYEQIDGVRKFIPE